MMKKSIIVQKSSLNQQKNISKTIQYNQKPQLSVNTLNNANLSNQTLEGVFKIMNFIIKRQQTIQSYKQMLTQRTDFNPQALFYYIVNAQAFVQKKSLINLFQENSLSITQEQLKIFFNSYGYKEKLDYSAFINVLFPVDTDLLKYISVTGIKRYGNQTKVTQEALFIFFTLINEQIKLLEDLDSLKNQLIPKITRKQIKQLMRLIKKSGECNSQMEIQSQNFIKYEELKTLFKKLVAKNVAKNPPASVRGTAKKINSFSKPQIETESIYLSLQKNLPCIFRKLAMGKNNFINLEELEFWLRPWSKSRSSISLSNEGFQIGASNVLQISGVNQIEEWSQISIKGNVQFPLTLVHNE